MCCKKGEYGPIYGIQSLEKCHSIKVEKKVGGWSAVDGGPGNGL